MVEKGVRITYGKYENENYGREGCRNYGREGGRGRTGKVGKLKVKW